MKESPECDNVGNRRIEDLPFLQGAYTGRGREVPLLWRVAWACHFQKQRLQHGRIPGLFEAKILLQTGDQVVIDAETRHAMVPDMNLNQNIYEQLEEQEQAKLNAAGLSDVIFKIGWFRVGDNLRLEARLAGPEASKKKAQQLLSFTDAK